MVLLVVLTGVLIGGGIYYNRRLHTEKLVALEQRNLALKALNRLIYDVQERLAQTPATRSLRQSLLGTAIGLLEEIERSGAGTAPDLSQAVAYQKLGDIFRSIGRAGEARGQYLRSLRIADGLISGDPATPPPARSPTSTGWASASSRR